MNDEETVALIAGGHTFGRHGAGDPESVGPEPERLARGAGFRLAELVRHGHRPPTRSPVDPRSSGRRRRPSGVTTSSPPVRIRVGAGEEPGGRAAVAAQGRRGERAPRQTRLIRRGVAHPRCSRPTWLALRPDLRADLRGASTEHPDEFADAFAAPGQSHPRDMGPVVRYLGPEVPSEVLIWQDPTRGRARARRRRRPSPSEGRIAAPSDGPQLVRTAWARHRRSAGSEQRGGANGARSASTPA